MHYPVSRFWVVLLLLIAGAVSLPQPSYIDSTTQTLADSAVQSLHIDSNSAQASFIVPCPGCFTGPQVNLNQSFLFDFQAFPSETPCGPNNVSLNGIPLLQQWESTGIYGQGLTSLSSSGHELNVVLRSDCLTENDTTQTSATQLLTLTIEQIDRENIRSVSGFTLSFKQFPVPELLRLSLRPDYAARDLPDSETWRDPPATLRLPAAIPEEISTSDSETTLSLEEQLRDLEDLETQANELVKLIQDKKDFIKSHFPEQAKCLKDEIKHCDSFLCVVKTIGRHVHDAAHAVYEKIHNSNQAYVNWKSSADGQAPTMLSNSATTNVVEAPEDCHCKPSKAVPKAPPFRGDITITSTSLEEKRPYHNGSQPHVEEPQWRDASDPSVLIGALKFLAVITGLAFIFRLLRRICMSDRTRAERAAERERRATERMYKCAATKQNWRDWWQGRRRGKPGYRHGDYDEKRALILQQEGILEGAMQDEIQQLRIREEIRQLRNTRDAVDDIVRAEEGRSVLPAYATPSSRRRAHPFGFHPLPAPITIPTATSGMYPSHHSPHHHEDDHPGTPLSRTSSLPDYKTDVSSEPPAYDSDGRSSFGDHDAFSEYEHSIHTTDSVWSPGSSIPDLSPRPSIETAKTFV